MARNLNAVAAFCEMVESASLTTAAKKLGLPKSTVSRWLSELEANLGVRNLLRLGNLRGLRYRLGERLRDFLSQIVVLYP